MPRRASTPMVNPSAVRYIKLGMGGGWEKPAIERDICIIGFGSYTPDRYRWSVAGDWKALTTSFVKEGRSKGTATRFTNELRQFFEDHGSKLWITFMRDRLYWGFLEGRPRAEPKLEGVSRRVRGGWRSTDINGEELRKDRLSGGLTQLASYRGTSCSVRMSDYVIRRINGQKTPEVESALAATASLKQCVLEMVRLLTTKDFELLVDLIFTQQRLAAHWGFGQDAEDARHQPGAA